MICIVDLKNKNNNFTTNDICYQNYSYKHLEHLLLNYNNRLYGLYISIVLVNTYPYYSQYTVYQLVYIYLFLGNILMMNHNQENIHLQLSVLLHIIAICVPLPLMNSTVGPVLLITFVIPPVPFKNTVNIVS